MPYFISITSQGQMSIPVSIRRRFALDKTKKALVDVVGDTIVVRPVTDILTLEGSFKTGKKISPKTARRAFEEALAKGTA